MQVFQLLSVCRAGSKWFHAMITIIYSENNNAVNIQKISEIFY